jgi:hypothetical protein
MTQGERVKASQQYCRQMTVVAIRSLDEDDYDEVVFLESAQFYRLMKQRPGYDAMLGKLRSALSDAVPVTVCFESIEDDCIRNIR